MGELLGLFHLGIKGEQLVALRIVGREFVPGKGWDFTRFGPHGRDLREPGVHRVPVEEFPPSKASARGATPVQSRVHYFREKARKYARAEQIAFRVESLFAEDGEVVGVQVAFAEPPEALPAEELWLRRPRKLELDPRKWPDGEGGTVDLVALEQVVEIPASDYDGNYRRFHRQMNEAAKVLEVEVEIRRAYGPAKLREDGKQKAPKEVGALVRFRPQSDPAKSGFASGDPQDGGQDHL